MNRIILDDKNAKQLGRTLIGEDEIRLILSGTGCEFSFTGRRLTLTLGCGEDCLRANEPAHFPRTAILINGRPAVKKTITALRESFTVFESDFPETVNVRIVKLSEAAYGDAVIFPIELEEGESISPSAERSMKIEFIGDSITCGYGVDNTNPESEFSTSTENVMKSYSCRTVELLGADYSMFSASGYGIISGYTDDGTLNPHDVIPPFYGSFGDSLYCVSGEKKPQDIAWDFSRFVPDAVVINLGTNDHSYCLDDAERRQSFEDAYLDFICTVRSKNPGAMIFCVLGIMGAELCPQVRNAVQRYCSETGDIRIRTYEFAAQDGRLGFSTKWHPSEDTHLYAAESLAEFIREEMGL